MGMAHRGRLNVLANILDKPYADDLLRVRGQPARPTRSAATATSSTTAASPRTTPTPNGRTIHVSPRPPTRATSRPSTRWSRAASAPSSGSRGDSEHRRKVLPLLIHGDAAFAGQGLVAETLNLSQLEGYRTGGTIHVVVNNQIGFTTLPGRGALHALLHRRGQDDRGADLPRQRRRPRGGGAASSSWRCASARASARDVVIDMFCYRRHGHNEGDEPAFTQPLMYRKIENHPPVRASSTQRSSSRTGCCRCDDSTRLADEFARPARTTRSRPSRRAARCPTRRLGTRFGGAWTGLDQPYCHRPGRDRRADTAVLERGGARADHGARGLPPQPARSARRLPEQLEAVRARRRRSTGRSPSCWPSARLLARGHPGAAERPGQRPRHLLPAPRRLVRHEEPGALRPAQPRPRRPGALLRLQQHALRGRGARLRLRLLAGRAATCSSSGRPSSATSPTARR